MKQKSQNRFLAALLAVAMMLQMLPMLAFADGTTGTGEVWNKTEVWNQTKNKKYTSLVTAVEEADSGDTIELGAGSLRLGGDGGSRRVRRLSGLLRRGGRSRLRLSGRRGLNLGLCLGGRLPLLGIRKGSQ